MDDGKSAGAGQTGRRTKRTPEPKPKRQLRQDPVENMAREVNSILNKITPQTFDKLTHRLLLLPIENDAVLEKVNEHGTDQSILKVDLLLISSLVLYLKRRC